MVKALGVPAADEARLTEALMSVQNARQELRDKVDSGEIARADLGREAAALRERSDKQIRDIVGDDGLKKLQDMRQRGPGGGGPRWGGGPGGPGGLDPPPR
jgi:hypothetical protein